MSLRQVIVEIPEKILITEKKTEKDFAIELKNIICKILA